MKYFQVNLDVEVTGVKDGINQIEIDKKSMLEKKDFDEFLDFFSTKNIDFWYSQNKIQFLQIPLIRAKLLKNAKITDIMGYTPNVSFLNYLYSEKYINIIKAFITGNYATFEVSIENVLERYFMLFFDTICLEEINYEKSTVVTGYKISNNIKYHEVNNVLEYIEFRQKNVLGRFEKLAISKEHYGKDIISTQATSGNFYSERLIDFLLDCGITGLHVKYNNSVELVFV